MIEREKKMNKKITAVFLVMCVLASAVAGCKNADAAVETTEAAAASAVESTAESEAAADSETEAEEPVETEATEATEATTEATTAETTAPKVEPKEPKLELDGNKKTKITVKENSYYEGDRFVLYFQEGAKIKGDIAKTVERVMKEDEDVIGLSFDNYSHCTESTWRVDCFGGGGAFFGINEDMSKVNILIMKNPDNGTIEWAMPDCVYLFDTTFDRKYKDGGHDTLFHELAHALRLRNGVNLGDIFEEGVALYAQDRVSRKEKYADWPEKLREMPPIQRHKHAGSAGYPNRNKHRHKARSDIVQHKGKQRFIGPKICLKDCRQNTPHSSRYDASHRHQRNEDEIGKLIAKIKHTRDRRQATDKNLSVAAQVPKLHLEGRYERNGHTKKQGGIL